MTWLWVVLAVLALGVFAFPTGTRGALDKTAERMEPATHEATTTPSDLVRPAVLSSPLNDRLAHRHDGFSPPGAVTMRQPKEGAPGEASGAPDGKAAA